MTGAPHAAHHPENEDAVAALLRDAGARRARLEIVGGGSRRALGRPVREAERLSTAGLSGVALYEPAALTLVARAGTPLDAIEATLAAEGQRLAFEPIDHRGLLDARAARPTLGGAVAVGASGPRRIQAGGCRDFVLGARFVNGRGEAVKAGGRVMKNVTGYDLARLMAGAYGTLGVLTELSLKVLPAPELSVTLLLRGLDDARAVGAMAAALGSPYDVTGAAHLPAGGDGSPVTMIRLEGFEASVRGRAMKLSRALAAFAPAETVDDPAETAAGWAYVRDCGPFAETPGAVWRVSVKPSDGPKLAAAVAARREARVYYDWGGGLVWLWTPEAGSGGALNGVDPAGAETVRAETARLGGAATLVRAAPAIREAVAVFPPEDPARARLSAGLRAKFDPYGVLNPGRMGP